MGHSAYRAPSGPSIVFDPMIPESALTPLPGILPSKPSSTPIVPDDVLVFEQRSEGARLIGGTGRGAGWAEIVEFAAADEPLASRAWNSGMPVRVAGGVPTRIVGPYWAAHAIVVPLGQDHLVVFGSSAPIAVSDATAVRMAAQAVAGISSVPAEKLLADELEVVHALRALMAYRPETVSDTARHIASVAARALSCEVGAVQVWSRDATTLEVHPLRRRWHVGGRVGRPGGGGIPSRRGVADGTARRADRRPAAAPVGRGDRVADDPADRR